MVHETGVKGVEGEDYVVVEDGSPSCDHTMENDDLYDKPGPDPRNPIRVAVCKSCDREVHHATSLSFSKPKDFYDK